jgi:ABC-type branched-subunit amino acid transport system ATPase component
MLEIIGLSAGYGPVSVLRDCSFAVAKGDVVGILGHNGMGKTTLLRTLMGHLRSSGGHILFEQADITQLPVDRRARRGLSLVPQGREIFPNLTVRDNLRMALVRRSRAEETRAIEQLMTEMPRLRPFLNRIGSTLSGGEQQLLAVACCLATAPKLVLLDEPTEGIQPSIIDELTDIFLRIRRERQLTVLLVEQNLDFVNGLADRILIIQRGRITNELERAELTRADLVSALMGFGEGPIGGGSAAVTPSARVEMP